MGREWEHCSSRAGVGAHRGEGGMVGSWACGERGTNVGGGAEPAAWPPPAQSSPSGAERLNTITREMGPSCRIVQVCRTSVWRARTQGPAPSTPAPPGPAPPPRVWAPAPAITSTLLVYVSDTDITALTAES